MLRQDIRKIILSPYYYLSILVTGIVLYLGCGGEIYSDFLDMYENSDYAGMISRVAPLITVLAVADIYCVERRDGFHYSMLIRSNKAKYCYSKILTAMFTGFTVMLFGMFTFYLMCQVVSGGMPIVGKETMEFYQDDPTMLGDMARAGRGWMILFLRIVLFTMSGMIWPVMSLAVARFTDNRYLVMVVPVIYCQVMSALMQLIEFHYLDPLILDGGLSGTMDQMWGKGITYGLGMICFYILLCGGIFRTGVEKSLR